MSLPFPSPPNLLMSACSPPDATVSAICESLTACFVASGKSHQKVLLSFSVKQDNLKSLMFKTRLPVCQGCTNPLSPPLLECSGGLAERLSRLQNRQRSAVSFWRHESLSSSTAETGEADRQLAMATLNTQIFTFSHITITATLLQQ